LSISKAVAADGITVNVVSPGTIHSSTLDNRFREIAATHSVADKGAPWKVIERAVLPMFAHVPIGRIGRLNEIANGLAFLASPRAGNITGINFRIDRGLSSAL
jgi:3-oxoacyl-[acyl-carrier protein] reductase